MCIYLEWLYIWLWVKLAMCIASDVKRTPALSEISLWLWLGSMVHIRVRVKFRVRITVRVRVGAGGRQWSRRWSFYIRLSAAACHQ